MNKNSYTFRLEKEEDYREVENLIRESFWNIYRPGCSEHYVIHVLRNDPAFVQELDFVMEKNGRIIGQNMFMKTIINADDGRNVSVLTMGPICIIPELKRQGYGKALLDYSLEKAKALGFGAVLFEGNIEFYAPVSKFSKSKSAYKQKESKVNTFFEDIWFVPKAAKNNSCQIVMPRTKRDC